ncbi:7TM chemoreceptor [Ancylostoma caninum]|uniref:7TM chemoreceptor n=1 Tax=Ancylostoma caninum TaxID=29170 RepID=A0A368GC58_ANCCA|nr:7TM chemoreceptor [Ancylostoma caninum]
MAITSEYTFLFLCTGPLRQWPYGQTFMALFCFGTISTILFVTNNFVYRYLQLCKPRILHAYPHHILLSIGGAFNIVISANWMAMIYFCLWPSGEFLFVSEEIWPNTSSIIAQTSYIAISNRDGADPFKLGLLIESLVLLLSLAQVNPYCAMEIHKCLKINSLSAQTKKLHRQMLKLLTVQTACPTLLMHCPLGMMYLFLFAGVTSPPVMEYCIGILMAIFPLSVPITIIIFMKEYRNFLLVKLRLEQPAPSITGRSVAVTTTTIKSYPKTVR